MAVMLPHPQQMFFIGLILIIFLALFITSVILYLKTRKKNRLVISLITGIILLGTIGYDAMVYTDYQYQLTYDILDYTLDLQGSSNGTHIVYVPVSQNEALQNQIRITSGNGTISLFDSMHGTSLKITFSGGLQIHGRIDTTEEIDPHNLTQRCQNDTDDNQQYWIFSHSSTEVKHQCSFKLTYYHESLDCWETHLIENYLQEGWNSYPCNHSILS
jgi:hypothetical protein